MLTNKHTDKRQWKQDPCKK